MPNLRKKNLQPPRQKVDSAIIVAFIGLTGTIVTAIFASPVILALIQKAPTQTPTIL